MAKKRGAAARWPGPAPRPCGLLAFRGESGRSLQRFTSSWHEKSRLCAHTWRAELARPLAPPPPMPSRQEDAYAEDEAHRPPRARAQPSPSSSRLRARSSLFKRRRLLLHFATFDFNSRLKVGAGGGGEEWAHLAACPLPPAERPQPVGRTLGGRSERPDNYLQVLFLPDWRLEGGLVPGRARRQARCPASAPPSATLWPPNAAHEALRPGPP